MKEGCKSADEPAKKQKKRRGRSSLSKWRKERQQKKSMPIEGRGAPADIPESADSQQGGSWRARCTIRPLNMEQMEKFTDSLGDHTAHAELKLCSNHSDTHEDRECMVSISFT